MAKVVRMSGALARDELAVLAKQIGDDAWQRTLAELPDDIRRAVHSVTHLGWIEVEFIKAVFLAAARVTKRDPLTVHREAVAAGLEQTYSGVWKLLMRLTTDQALVSRTPVVYAKSYDTGTLTSAITAPGKAEIVLDGWPDGEPYSLRGVAIAVETTLRIGGRRDVVVTHEQTPNGARYAASWRA